MTWKTVVVLGCCCALALAALLVDRRGSSKDTMLLSINPEQVNEVTVISGSDTVVAARAGGIWRVLRPVEDVADSEAVAAALGQMGEATSERSFPGESALSSFGLDPPRICVIARGENGDEGRLALGGSTPAGTHRYAATADAATVHLVPDRVFVRIENAAQKLRSRRIMHAAADAVDTLRYLSDGGAATLVRSDGAWSMEEPVRARADNAAVRNLLRSLAEPVVIAFIPEVSRPPHARWVITARAWVETLTVFLSAPDSLIVGTSIRPFALVVDTSLSSQLVGDPGRWRSREVVPMFAYDVRSLELVGKGDTLRVHRVEPGGWRVGNFAADAHTVMGFIRGLEAARVDTFLGDIAKGPWARELLLTLEGRDGERASLEIGPRQNGTRRVTAAHLGGAAEVSGLDVDSLAMEPGFWRSRRLVDVDSYGVDRITVHAGDVAATATREGLDRWKRGKGWSPDADPDTLMAAFANARIARFPEEGVPQQFRETAKIVLVLDDVEQSLTLGWAEADSLLVRVDDGPVVAIGDDLLPEIRRCLRR